MKLIELHPTPRGADQTMLSICPRRRSKIRMQSLSMSHGWDLCVCLAYTIVQAESASLIVILCTQLVPQQTRHELRLHSADVRVVTIGNSICLCDSCVCVYVCA